MLNRKQRRANKLAGRRPSPNDSPAKQFATFLKQPGKIYAVMLPDEKSFVVKVTEAEMPIFVTMCAQLRAVLGFCDAQAMTPVEAHVASTEEVAQSSAESTKRIREARARQEAPAASNSRPKPELAEVDASMARHPAGKKRPAAGRHRADEPDTTFDRLVASGVVDNNEGAARIAALEIAAAQDGVARVEDELEAARQRLRDAYDNGGDIHNAKVLDGFTDKAAQAIADQAEQIETVSNTQEVGKGGGQPPTPFYPHFKTTGPDSPYTAGVDGEGNVELTETDTGNHVLGCPFCPTEVVGLDRTGVVQAYMAHLATHKPPTDAK